MKKLLYLIPLFLISFANAARIQSTTGLAISTNTTGAESFIHNASASQVGQFNISSGTIRGKLMFNVDGNTYFELTGDDLFLFVHGSLRQTWTTVQADNFLLLEGGDFVLLESGDKIILEGV